MPTTTFYPAAGSYGTINTELGSWAAAHGATTGTVDNSSGSFPFIESFNSGGTWKIWRYFCPFDTSSIPDNAIITSAELVMDCYSVDNTDADGNDFVTVIQTTQASSSTLVATDYDNVGTTKGSDDVDVDDIATRVNYSWNLNSTGLGWINKSGTTFLGLREGHDLNNSSISANTQVSLRVYQANNNEPKLVVTYTLTGDATGGTITYSGGNTIHTFTNDGTFTVPTGSGGSVESLVVGGGGSGSSAHGAGGGAGGVSYDANHSVSAQVYSITVGSGGAAPGAGTTKTGNDGSTSTFDTISSGGGGGGSVGYNGTNVVGRDGLSPNGSGGGSGGAGTTNNLGGTGDGDGTNGGSSSVNGQIAGAGGGGGGAGANGANATGTGAGGATGGAGGNGVSTYSDLLISANAGVDISGTHWIAGGGGGGGWATTGANGGNGGGGKAGNSNQGGTAGVANTGSGGGGSGDGTAGTGGGAGGSGIVIISYPTGSLAITSASRVMIF